MTIPDIISSSCVRKCTSLIRWTHCALPSITPERAEAEFNGVRGSMVVSITGVDAMSPEHDPKLLRGKYQSSLVRKPSQSAQ